MPVWLITFLTGIIEPIVQKLVTKAVSDIVSKMNLSAIAKDKEKANAGFIKLAQAQTSEDRDAALDLIGSAFNGS